MKTEDFVQEISLNLDRALDDNEIQDIDMWVKGRELMHIFGTEAWEIILATLDAQAQDAQDKLMSLAPGDERVGAVHGTAAGITQAVWNFKAAIQRQVEASQTMPDVMKQQIRALKETE